MNLSRSPRAQQQNWWTNNLVWRADTIPDPGPAALQTARSAPTTCAITIDGLTGSSVPGRCTGQQQCVRAHLRDQPAEQVWPHSQHDTGRPGLPDQQQQPADRHPPVFLLLPLHSAYHCHCQAQALCSAIELHQQHQQWAQPLPADPDSMSPHLIGKWTSD